MATRIAWLTDLHLDFVASATAQRFAGRLADLAPDAVAITGDVATAHTLRISLETLARGLRCPVYFVLGNHDYYHGSILAVREGMARGFRAGNLRYLSTDSIVQLGQRVALVGHDGWADARNGDYAHSSLELNDFYLIADFLGLDRWGRARLMERLAGDAAAHLTRWLPEAAAQNRHVIVATHVPPFWEAALYQGRPSSPDSLPFFSSSVVREVVLAAARAHPSCQITVLCGHTHEAAAYRPAPNLEVRVAAAEYSHPAVADVIELREE